MEDEMNLEGKYYSSMDELKAAAFEYLLFNPGTEFSEWRRALINGYSEDLVDTYGIDPEDVYAALDDLWESDYYDERTDIEQHFSDWAEAFATERSVDLYYLLVEAKR